jgi:hypothetical protein
MINNINDAWRMFLKAMKEAGWTPQKDGLNIVTALVHESGDNVRIPGEAQVNAWFGQWLRTNKTPPPF